MLFFAVAARSRLAAWLMLAVAIAVGVMIFALPKPDNPTPDSSNGLSSSWQSARVEQLTRQLPNKSVQPAIVVVSRRDGMPLRPSDQATVAQRSRDLARLAVGGQVAPPQVSPDGSVALVAVPFSTIGGDEAVTQKVKDLRSALAGWPAELNPQVTGGPAFTTDLTAVFDGADVTLLAATTGVVAVLLLLTYRSPFLWLVPLVVVAATEQVTLRAVETLVPALGIPLDAGATTGITSILVFGAATDYALLLIARYREELRGQADRFLAMRTALRRTAEPILASGGTVILAVLTLLLSQQEGNRALGVACAMGVLLAMASSLFVLPAALVLFGRGLFWPFVPKVGSPAREGRVWGRLGTAVAARPIPVALLAAALLAGLASGALGLQTGLSETEQFRVKPEAVLGAQVLAKAFPAGTTQPLTVLTNPNAAQAVAAKAKTVNGVASAAVGETAGGLSQVDVVLTAEPGTLASDAALRALRDTVAAIPASQPSGTAEAATSSSVSDRGALVGGQVAAALDLKDANSRDLRTILPLILLLVGAVLVLLLRSLLAPALLVITVIASFFASLGASWLLFDHVLGFPALDSGVVLLSFVFLVALGVDYNIFLVTRAREDAQQNGTRAGMLSALRVTGGVITSAGVLLAAVFAVLGVLPLIVLTQIGIIVGVGVLLDTLLVRTVLVPALAFIAGDKFWWPASISNNASISDNKTGAPLPAPSSHVAK
jgi:putative drug exporter of the RND superfamily